MKVKKFICRQCGAPKINPYDGIFIICDFCNSMVEIDMWAKFEKENEDPAIVREKKELNNEYTQTTYALLKDEKLEELLDYLRKYVFKIYELTPYAIPPNLPKGLRYEEFMHAFADFRLNKLLATHLKTSESKYMSIYNDMVAYEKDGRSYVKATDVVNMIDAFLEHIDKEMDIMYSGPKAEIIEEYWPREFYRKAKVSEGIRNWLPSIEDHETDGVLNHFNLTQEYIEINIPEMKTITCGGCEKEIEVPIGSLKTVCLDCRYENIIHSTVNCRGCGIENNIPEKWNMKINCIGCGTELRLVPPLFA